MGRVEDIGAVTTRSGQRIGIGDRVATRRNDRDLGVANRDTWHVVGVGRNGGLHVTPSDAAPAAVTPAAVPPTGRGLPHVTPATEAQRVLPADYVAAHVELAYASTAHGVQGDTVSAAHLVIGESTGAASAYVGMTRGREANTAHLVAADLAEAREQWIAVFGRDRADLGPAHAAELAARESARYAQPRPLDQVLAELQSAWTDEERSRVLLAINEPVRDRLQQLVALGWHPEERLEGLQARYWQTGRDADQADKRLQAADAAAGADTDRIRDQLLDAWNGQRDAARQAAAVVLQGPGLLGLRRGAVTRAGAELTAWTDTWRPYLPSLPADRRRLAEYANRSDDRAGLWRAFDAAARRTAEQAHPEHAALQAAAAAAQDAHAQAARALNEGRREQDAMVSRFGRVADTPDPAAVLAEVDREITAARTGLAAARARIAHLTREPALLGLPPDRIDRERDAWRVRRTAEHQQRRPVTRRRPDPYARDRVRSAGHSGPGIGR
jgi:exodeoxyribonuclease V alpha subunit